MSKKVSEKYSQEKMNAFVQAGYKMLMIMSVIDGQYAVSEGKVIVDFLANYFEGECDIDKENEALLRLPKDNIPASFMEYSKILCDNVEDESQLIDFTTWMYRLIEADGRIALEEAKVFKSFCHFAGLKDLAMLVDPAPETNMLSEVNSILSNKKR